MLYLEGAAALKGADVATEEIKLFLQRLRGRDKLVSQSGWGERAELGDKVEHAAPALNDGAMVLRGGFRGRANRRHLAEVGDRKWRRCCAQRCRELV